MISKKLEHSLVLSAIQEYPYETNGIVKKGIAIPFTHSIRDKHVRQAVNNSDKDEKFMEKVKATIQFHSHPTIRSDGPLWTELSPTDKKTLNEGDVEVLIAICKHKIDLRKYKKGICGKHLKFYYVIRVYKKLDGKIIEINNGGENKW
jgi:hypothetical protein